MLRALPGLKQLCEDTLEVYRRFGRTQGQTATIALELLPGRLMEGPLPITPLSLCELLQPVDAITRVEEVYIPKAQRIMPALPTWEGLENTVSNLRAALAPVLDPAPGRA